MLAALLATLVVALPGAAFAEEDCTAAAPVALLEAAAYQDHAFRPGKKTRNTATETATLASGVKLRIEGSGCYDVAEKQFVFTAPLKAPAATDLRYWADWAGQRVAALAFTKDEKPTQALLAKFLKKAPELKSSRKDGVAVSECMDGSRPGPDGCDFKQLGTYELAVKAAGGSTVVTVTWIDNL